MRVRRIDTPCFGTLTGRSFEFGEGVTVVLGPNEAGKTTFHTAFETLLYGFDPANREQHPLAAWNQEVTLHLEGELEPDHGKPVRVERLLQSAPTFRTGTPGEDFESKRERSNVPLSEIQAIPRALYRQVYSLEAGETLSYKDDVKEHINELLLGETGLASALPLHEVRSTLQVDRQSLWRNDNRGKHRAADLRKAIKEAGSAYKEARSVAKAAQQAETDRAQVRERLLELRSRKTELKRSLEDAVFARNRADLEERRARLSPRVLGALDRAPRRDPALIEAERKALEDKLEEPRMRLALPEPEVTEQDALWIANADAIAAVLEAHAEHRSTQRRIETLRNERSDAHKLAVNALLDLGAKPDAGALQALPLARLKTEAKRWRDHEPTATTEMGRTGLVLAGIGMLCALVSILPAVPGALAFGVVLVVPALLQGLRPQAMANDEAPDDVIAMLAPLGLTPRDAAELDDMVRDLELARIPLAQAAKADDQCSELEAIWEQHEAGMRRLQGTLRLDDVRDAAQLAETLKRRLGEARARVDGVRDDLADRRSSQILVDTHADALDALTRESAAARAFLTEGWPERPELADAWKAWKQELAEFHQFESRESELKADPRWDTVEPARTAVDDLQAEQETLAAEIEQAVKDESDLSNRIEANPDDVARVHERLLALRGELDTVRVERDRLALLEAILNLAEFEHRGEHQPPVLKRASEYLAAITGDRYASLDYPEGPTGKLTVRVQATGERIDVDDPLSRGTQEQIYVCLRLGTLDYLDRGREALPLVLDEALVHWDEGRRKALYPVLQAIAEHRQVVLFTCHDLLADEARDQMDARVIDLSDESTEAIAEIPMPVAGEPAADEAAPDSEPAPKATEPSESETTQTLFE